MNSKLKFPIFPRAEPEKCKQHESRDYPSECFSFQIPSDVDVSTVEAAQLWVYKEPGKLIYDPLTHALSQVTRL